MAPAFIIMLNILFSDSNLMLWQFILLVLDIASQFYLFWNQNSSTKRGALVDHAFRTLVCVVVIGTIIYYFQQVIAKMLGPDIPNSKESTNKSLRADIDTRLRRYRTEDMEKLNSRKLELNKQNEPKGKMIFDWERQISLQNIDSHQSLKSKFEETFLSGHLICRVSNVSNFLEVHIEEYSKSFFQIIPYDFGEEADQSLERSCIIDHIDQPKNTEKINNQINQKNLTPIFKVFKSILPIDGTKYSLLQILDHFNKSKKL